MIIRIIIKPSESAFISLIKEYVTAGPSFGSSDSAYKLDIALISSTLTALASIKNSSLPLSLSF